MKIASDYFNEGLGTSLGYLVGALVLGTAFPHLLKSFTGTEGIPWRLVLIITSGLALLGGILIFLFVPDGPHRTKNSKFDPAAFIRIFRLPGFRRAALGYFGHMWELYAFWAFIPLILETYDRLNPEISFRISLLSFIIIGVGGLACVLSGYHSRSNGLKRTASTALLLSGCCCLLSPVIFLWADQYILLVFLIFWGITVVADSPLFSTLVATNAPAEHRGTGLTIVNSIGFAITVVSIETLNFLISEIPIYYLFLILAVGPALGLLGSYTRIPKAQ